MTLTVMGLFANLHINDTQDNNTLYAMSLCRVSRFIYCYAECRYAECRCAECCYAECRYAECRYAECHAECRYAECRYAECRGAFECISASQSQILLLFFFLKPWFLFTFANCNCKKNFGKKFDLF